MSARMAKEGRRRAQAAAASQRGQPSENSNGRRERGRRRIWRQISKHQGERRGADRKRGRMEGGDLRARATSGKEGQRACRPARTGTPCCTTTTKNELDDEGLMG